MFLLKDTTQWRQWGSNPRPLGLSQALYHWATALPKETGVYVGCDKVYMAYNQNLRSMERNNCFRVL